MAKHADSEAVRLLKQAVLNQIADGDPPETAATLARLQREGMSKDEALRWIAAALLQELNVMLRDHRVFDRDAYAAALDRLPDFPITESR
jgi:hypothetical protein